MSAKKKVDIKKMGVEEFSHGIKILRNQIKELRKEQVKSFVMTLKTFGQIGLDGKDWQKLNDKYESQIAKRQKVIETLLEKASPEQRMAANKSRNRIYMGIGVIFIIAVISIPIINSNINKSIEESRDYYINIAQEYDFDCNASFDEKNQKVLCEEQEITGDFSNYESVEFRNDEADVTEKNFAVKISQIEIPASEYQSKEYSHDVIIEKYGSETAMEFALFNSVLERDVMNKTVKVKWNFTDADFELLDQKNNEWRVAEAERKAAEEARIAEETAKVEAERVLAEQKTAAEATMWAQNQVQTTPSTNGNVPEETSVVDGNIEEGYCDDGTFVRGNPSAKGAANACYKHGGWAKNN